MDPIFPPEIIHLIIENVADCICALSSSGPCLPPGFNAAGESELDPWNGWDQTLRSLSVVSRSVHSLCQPYLNRVISISSGYPNESEQWKAICHWYPPAVEKIFHGDEDSNKSMLESIKGLAYCHHGLNLEYSDDGEPSLRRTPEENKLLSLPALRALYLSVDPALVITEPFDQAYTTDAFGFWTLLDAYAMGRPDGVAFDGDPMYAAYEWYNSTPTLCSNLTYLSLTNLIGLPLIPLLTSPTVVSIHLNNCEFEPNAWEELVLYSDCSKEQLSSGGVISLVPFSSNDRHSRPGFNLRRWEASGGIDVTPSLLRYCTQLEHLDITSTDGIATASPDWYEVQIIHHDLLPKKVEIPEPRPFQKVKTMNWLGNIDMAYFCTLVEQRDDGTKLFPALKELTLADVYTVASDEGTDDNCGPDRVLSRHVSSLEVLRQHRGFPTAINLAQAVSASSGTLKELYLDWNFRNRDPINLFRLCDALDMNKGTNVIKILEVKLEFFDIDFGVFFEDLEDYDAPACPWTRIATLLSLNPSAHFPHLQRVVLDISICLAKGECFDMVPVGTFQERLGPMLALDSKCRDSIAVKCKVSILADQNGSADNVTWNVFNLPLVV